MRNNKKLIAVAMCLSVGLASYKSYQDYKKSSENNLLIQEVEALTSSDVNNNDTWYLHNFKCDPFIVSEVDSKKLLGFVKLITIDGSIYVDLSSLTQYFNHVETGGFGPCDKGPQYTCMDAVTKVLESLK